MKSSVAGTSQSGCDYVTLRGLLVEQSRLPILLHGEQLKHGRGWADSTFRRALSGSVIMMGLVHHIIHPWSSLGPWLSALR